MKKFTLFLIGIITVTFSFAQTVYTTPQAYDAMKQAGTLNPRAHYKFLEASAHVDQNHVNLTTEPNTMSFRTTTTSACQCMVPVDPTFSVVPMVGYFGPEYRNDDGFSASIPLGFNFCFYGTTYTSCFINNNGNITFNTGLASFSAGGFPAGDPLSLDTIMIAPFWGDVDTRAAGSGLVYFKKTPTALIVKWSNVGYYSSEDDLKNDFQLIITDGTDPILVGGNNVAFCYGDMQWTTGAASSGVGGFGGIPATAGVNKGDRLNYVQLGRFDQAGLSYDGPYGLNDGISFLDNKSYFFNTCGSGGNLPPIIQDATGGGSLCGDTLKICALGDTLVYTTTFLAPEPTQSITITSSAPTLGGSFTPLAVTTSTAGLTTLSWMVIGSPTVTGVHTIVITGTDNGLPPLSTSATYYIQIKGITIPSPTLATSPTGTVCATPGATLTLINCTDYDNVYWSTGASGCSIIASATGPYYVTVEKTGCYKSTKDSVFVFPNPIPIVVGPLNYCSPATSTSLSLASPLAGMPSYSTYVWSPGSITTSTAALTGSSFGIPYTVLVTDINGCSASAAFTVSTNSPTLSLTASPLSICGAGTTTLTASISGATSYSWSNGATTQTTTVSSAGVYTCTVDAGSCIVTKTVNVVISPTPTVTIPNTVGMCSGASATVVAISFSPTGAYSYTWSTGSHASSITVTSATVVTLQVTNTTSGCTSLVSNSCSVVVAANPTVTLGSAPIVFCNGFNATLTPTVTGGAPAYTYSWTPVVLGTASTATTSTPGTYTVQVTDQNACKGRATITTVRSSPSVLLASPDLTICPGECATITAAGTSSFSPFTYSWVGSPSNTTNSITVCAAGDVVVNFTDAKGCIATRTITVVNDIVPVASFVSTPPSPVVPEQLINFASTSTISAGSITTSVWSFGDGNGASGNPVNYAYPNAGTFPVTLIVTSATGCKDTVTVMYTVEAVLVLPNVITPNGDNVNEVLKFKNLEFYNTNNIKIYNRWGKKLYEQDNYKNDWNGGGYVDGTYFYILTVPEASPNNYKGYFQIIR